ncbi:unnamed protein product, partial [marine sediment metagenome]
MGKNKVSPSKLKSLDGYERDRILAETYGVPSLSHIRGFDDPLERYFIAAAVLYRSAIASGIHE